MAGLPSGTVTFLFSDIEGSTARWERHPEAMAAALARHDALLQRAIAAHGGAVFKMVGDACCAAFATAPEALAAALAAQRALGAEEWGETSPLRVRMALHTGAAEERDGDYFGPPLNRVARLLAAGHGGQTLLSRATQELVRDGLPPEAELRDLGEHRLKDLIRPEQVFQLIAPDLPGAFPSLKTLDARPTNLPVQPTLLIGRERELAAVSAILRRPAVRLVTLTGPGGTGKTRLGLQVAADLLDDFADGAWFVPLAPIGEPDLVPSAIAATLGVKESGGQPLLTSLREYLRDKQVLLLLDNFEQVVVAAGLVAELLAAAPRLMVLVTSRAALRLSGEQEYPVPPLALPDPRRLPPLERLTQYEAVRLFVERAQAVQPDFAVTNATAPAVAEICQRLDGLPLAIELAAARTKLLPPPALLARLIGAAGQTPLRLLTGGARDLPARQQTLRGAIDWSYNLLAADEQTLFARLAVLVGGGTLEAAEAIGNAEAGAPGAPPLDVLDGVASLLDKSLLRQGAGDPTQPRADDEPRFGMLETIREYATERLAASGELAATQRRHAEYFLALAEAAEPQLRGPEGVVWLGRLEAEHDNLRAALGWALAGGEVELGLRLVGALRWFWYTRGYVSEGRRWLGAVLAAERRAGAPGLAPGSAALRGKALTGAGVLAWQQGDYQGARTHHQESLALWRELGDQEGIAVSLSNLGVLARDGGDYEGARALYEEGLALLRELGDRQRIAASLNNLGTVAQDQGDYRAARPLLEESLALKRELGDQQGIAISLHNLGLLAARDGGDCTVVRALLEESLALKRELGDRWGIAASLHSLGTVAQEQGDYRGARALAEEGLALRRELGDQEGIVESLEGLAGISGAEGQATRAARLWGAAAALREALGAPLPLSERADHERQLAAARAGLADAAWTAAWEEGRAMPLAETVAYALEGGSDSTG